MGFAAWAGAVLLACAASGKVRSHTEFGDYLLSLTEWRIAPHFVWPVVLVEFSVAAALVSGEFLRGSGLRMGVAIGFMLVSLLFMGVQVVGLARGLDACRCFGAIDARLDKKVGLGRAVVVTILALLALATSSRSDPMHTSELTIVEGVVGALTALTVLAIPRVLNEWVIFERWERGVRQLYRQAALNASRETA